MSEQGAGGSVWETRERVSGGLLAVGIGAVAIASVGVVFGALAAPWIGVSVGVVVLLVAITLACFSAVRITVEQHRLVAHSAFANFRLMSVDFHEISSVSPGEFSAAAWGGWGLRFKGRNKALAVRGDRAAVIEKNDGRKVHIVIREADALVEELRKALSA